MLGVVQKLVARLAIRSLCDDLADRSDMPISQCSFGETQGSFGETQANVSPNPCRIGMVSVDERDHIRRRSCKATRLNFLANRN